MIVKIIRIINKFALYYGGLGLVIIGVIVSLRGNVSGGVVSVSAGFILFIFGLVEIDRIREFNFFNIAFKLRERLNEAEEIVNKMRSFLIPLCSISISSASLELKEHRGLSRKNLFDLVSDMEKSLLDVNASIETIEEIKGPYYDALFNCMLDDVMYRTYEIFTPIRAELLKEKTQILEMHKKELSDPYYHESNFIDADRYRLLEIPGIGLNARQHLFYQTNVNSYFECYKTYIFSIDDLNQEVKEKLVEGVKPILLDIDEYVKTHKIKNLEEFLNKQQTQ